MGNDDACQMARIGIIQIKMFVGMVRDLIDVRYVLQYVLRINKNIISVGAVESKGSR